MKGLVCIGVWISYEKEKNVVGEEEMVINSENFIGKFFIVFLDEEVFMNCGK